jgi:hypothetical protein
MVGAAMFADRLIRWRGYWWVILVTFLALPLRGILAASVIHQWGYGRFRHSTASARDFKASPSRRSWSDCWKGQAASTPVRVL